MPAQGQHRTSGLNRLTRIAIATGLGGALALPLAVAGTAAAAEPAKAPAVAKSVHTAPRTYTVVKGDTLAKIAAEQHVKGGWHRLYELNRQVVGKNPDLIRPGQHLVLGGHAAVKPGPVKKAAAKPAPAKKAAAAKPAARTVSASGYTAPVVAPIGTPYHQAGSNWASGYHTGVDFLVGSGTPIHAIAAGTVVHSGPDGAYGNDVILRHADGKYTLYAHMTQPLVSAGQSVTAGQEIGLSGATGNVTGPHLHFEVRTTPYYGSDIDPVAYLAAHGVTV